MTDFVHTDGVTQQQWATKVTANATATFGGRLAAQGLERLPHGVKVTGKAQQLWISDQEPTGAWYVPTSNGGYTALMDLTTPAGKVTDLTVFLRPQKAVQAFNERMTARLAAAPPA